MARPRTVCTPFLEEPRGIRVRVRLTPNSNRDAVDGLRETADGLALKVSVRAAPERGKANAALEGVLARWLGVPRTSVSLSGGAKARVKTLDVAGDAGSLERLISAKVRDLGG